MAHPVSFSDSAQRGNLLESRASSTAPAEEVGRSARVRPAVWTAINVKKKRRPKTGRLSRMNGVLRSGRRPCISDEVQRQSAKLPLSCFGTRRLLYPNHRAFSVGRHCGIAKSIKRRRRAIPRVNDRSAAKESPSPQALRQVSKARLSFGARLSPGHAHRSGTGSRPIPTLPYTQCRKRRTGSARLRTSAALSAASISPLP